MPNPLFSSAVLTSLETGVNLLIRSHPNSLQSLSDLNGKCIQFSLVDFQHKITLYFHAERIDLYNQDDAHANLIITGSLRDFLRLLQSRHPSEVLFGQGISLTGDIELAEQFSLWLKSFPVQWQHWFAQVAGEDLTQTLARIANQPVDQFQRWKQNSTATCSEYLQEEIRLIPANAEVIKFADDVDQLRDATERLEARIAIVHSRLQASISKQSSSSDMPFKKASSTRNTESE